MKVFLTNFDFEDRLSQKSFIKPSYNRINSSLEHLFFWTGGKDELLFSKQQYEPDYLSYIKEKRGFLVNIERERNYTDLWWGKNNSEDQWRLEKEVNSKETSFKCREELGVSLKDSQVAFHKEDLENKTVPFILKDFFGFSGRGLYFIESKSDLALVPESAFPILCEPLLNRIRDFGIHYSEDTISIVQNLNDKRGQFKGALTKKKFPEEELILRETTPVFKWYKDRFNLDDLQIDCFQYLDQGELKLNVLCEVNHRLTMGRVANSIQEEFGEQCSALLMVNRNRIIDFKTHQSRETALSSISFNSKVGVLFLSPVESKLQCYFLSERSDRALQLLITSWWNKIRLNKEMSLPREFIINS